MIYESDDAANRVEEIATELPGEFRWHMWIRGFAGMAVTVPAYGYAPAYGAAAAYGATAPLVYATASAG